MNNTYKTWAAQLQDHRLPTAVIDVDALDANLGALAQRAQGMPIRIASKSIRIPWVLERLLAHPACKGLLCYSAEEAVALAKLGFDDILVAYPTTQIAAIDAVAQQVKLGKSIILMADHAAHIDVLAARAALNDVVLPIAYDLDMAIDLPAIHFGVYRSPIRTVEQVLALYQHTTQYSQLKLTAIMGYEAAIAGVGDNVPKQTLKNAIIRRIKQYAIPRVRARREQIVSALRAAGADIKIVNGGGTGSIESTILDTSVNDVAVGSGFFTPVLFDFYHDFKHQPAAFFACEIARQAATNIFTVQGGGYIASGSIGIHKQPLLVYPPNIGLASDEGAGEVQTPIRLASNHHTAISDIALFRPAKSGEFLEHFTHVALMQNGTVMDVVQTYRGHGWCFY